MGLKEIRLREIQRRNVERNSRRATKYYKDILEVIRAHNAPVGEEQ